MTFTDLEKYFILRRAADDYEDHVKEKYGEKGRDDFVHILYSQITKDDWDDLITLEGQIIEIFVRRRWELRKSIFNSNEEEPGRADNKQIPPKTLQIGMFLFWKYTQITKFEDESDNDFERRKDIHDYLLGYANREMIEDPLVTPKEIIDEYEKQREKAQNAYDTFLRFMER